VGNGYIGGNLVVGGTISGALPLAVSKTFWQNQSLKENGVAFTYTYATSFASFPLYGYQYLQNPAAINDQWSQTFTFSAGTYTLSSVGFNAPNRGIITWELDGVVQGTMDYYATPGGVNTTKSIGITVLTGGTHTIRGKMLTKKGSSSDYFCSIQQFWIVNY
jgi:hypothetical protein